MTERDIYVIIGRDISGDISAEEKKVLTDWISQSDENKEEFELHQKIWKETHLKYNAPESEEVFKNILNKIDDKHEQELAKKYRFDNLGNQTNYAFIAKIAASLLIICTLGYHLYSDFENIEQPDTTIAIVQKQNNAGQKSKIFLPDGSEVWLNSESKISYPEQFTDNKREVTLEGEAYFNVVKNPDQPFTVVAEKISTTVLGTSFSVKSFPEENMAYVALNTGKVKVNINNGRGGDALYLNPGEAVRYDKKHQKSMKETIDKTYFFSWKDGTIVFKDAPMKEVINTLSRWYGVRFEIVNAANEDWSYTGTFDNEALENVLRSMSFTKDFSYDINQKNVSVKFN